jgi:hypothetical protein
LIRRLGSEEPESRTRDQMASKVESVVDCGMHAEHAPNDLRQHGRGPVKPPLKRARRISTPIGSSRAARSIEVSEMTAYGAIEPFAGGLGNVGNPPYCCRSAEARHRFG